MKIIKPIKNKITPDMMNINDPFYNYSHGISVDSEFTLCSVACEEWEHDKVVERKTITCPDCLRVIDHCKTYKPGRK